MSKQARPIADGRTERRVIAMRRVQEVALDAFEAKGWAAVTVEDVAREAGVGVATLFRNFTTKEGLVLWDEYDPALFEHVERHLSAGRTPAKAMLEGVCEALTVVYAKDKERILRRADLIAATPALAAAAHLGVRDLREGIERLLERRLGDRLARAVTAASLAATLEVAVEEWRRRRGRVALETVMRAAFAELERKRR